LLRYPFAVGLFLSGLPALPLTAVAAESAMPNLHEVVQRALERNPDQGVLAAKGAEVSAFEQRARGLLAGPPAVYGLYRTDAVGSDQGLQEMEADLLLPLWRFGQRGAEQQAAERRRAGVTLSRDALALTVAGQVREAVWEVAFRRNEARLAQKEWETARTLQRDVDKRVAAGELAKSDLMLAREETLRKETASIQAAADAEHAMVRYQVLTGVLQLPRDPDERKSQRETIAPNHPLLAEAEASVATARAGLSVASRSAGGSPELLVGGKRERANSGESYDNSLQVAVRIPFNIGPAAKPEVAAAGRILAEADAARTRVQRDLNTQLRTAGHELRTIEQRLVVAREENRIAADSLRLARRSFELGETDLVSLQRVQALAFAAERAEQQLKIVRQRAIASYNQAAGVMP
jgi:cobalt-zinc-cadmium efflux system outer membrane protein